MKLYGICRVFLIPIMINNPNSRYKHVKFLAKTCLNDLLNSLYTAGPLLRTLYKENYMMKYTLLAAFLVALTLSACGGKPSQALPETEKANYEKLMQEAEADSKK